MLANTDLKIISTETIKNTPGGSQLTLHIADKEDSKLECWTELKVKDRFINKRSYHAAVIHKSRLYVYGGQDLNVGNYSDFNSIQLNEEFMLSHWEPVTTKTKVSPGPLSRMISMYEDDKWYLFGGTINATENTNNLWCFDFTKNEWTLVKSSTPPSPPPLDSHSGGLYKTQGKTYIVSFGGFVGGVHGEYWNQVIKYDIGAKKWILPYKEDSVQYNNPSGPSPRSGHTASIFDGHLFVFGGTNGELRFNDMWRYDLSQDSWQKIKTKENPPPRNGHTSLIYKNQGLIIFGGIQDITHEKDDLLFFNFITNQWTILDGEQDHAKLATIRNNERATEALKLDRTNRGKSLTESPGKTRSSQFKDSRGNTKGFDSSQSPSKRGNTRGFDQSNSPTKRGISPGINSKELSPTRYTKLPSNNSFALSQSELRSTASPNLSRPYQGLTKENEEKRKKLFLVRKQNFLKEFEVTDPEEVSMLALKSPTTEAMKNSIIALNYKAQPGNESPGKDGNSQSPLKTKKKNTTLFGDLLADSFIQVKIPVNGKLNGRKPCARDGHTSVVYGNKMIIFGGDRHKMSFNDIYILNMKQMISPNDRDAL